MNEYTTGFLFDIKAKLVAVVLKETPEWMKGKYTGVGGKLKNGETPMGCMNRESLEEFRYNFAWRQFATLYGERNRDGFPFMVHMFVAYTNKPALILPAYLVTDNGVRERIEVLPIWQIRSTNSIPNVPWLIQMALSMRHDETVKLFNIQEDYHLDTEKIS